MKQDLEGIELHKKIVSNKELMETEIEGFERGKKKGKTMDVSLWQLWWSLEKQWLDLRRAKEKEFVIFLNTNPTYDELKRALADLRNVAGCLFLKIQDIEKKIQDIEKKGE